MLELLRTALKPRIDALHGASCCGLHGIAVVSTLLSVRLLAVCLKVVVMLTPLRTLGLIIWVTEEYAASAPKASTPSSGSLVTTEHRSPGLQAAAWATSTQVYAA